MAEFKRMSPEDRARVIAALRERGAGRCPICPRGQWEIAEYVRIEVVQGPNDHTLGGPSIPAVSVICGNCGFVAEHALARLGLWQPAQS